MEAAGAAASIAGLVSLTVQLGGSAVQLKRLCNSMRDAPANIENLAMELTIMEMHIQQFARHRGTAYDEDTFLIDCVVQRCKSSVQKITEAANKIEARMGRSKTLGRVYMSFKEADIAKLWQEVEREKSSLLLTWQAYFDMRAQGRQAFYEVQAQLRHAEQMRKMQDLLAMLSSQADRLGILGTRLIDHRQIVRPTSAYDKTQLAINDTIPSNNIDTRFQHPLSALELPAPGRSEDALYPGYRGRAASAHRRRNGKECWSVRIAPWFVKRVWQVSVVQAAIGWDVLLRTFVIVPSDAEIFEMVRRHSLIGVQRLLAEGKASLLVRDEHGRDLLDHMCDRAWAMSLELLSYLLLHAPELDRSTVVSRLLSDYLMMHSIQDESIQSPTIIRLADEHDVDLEESHRARRGGAWKSSSCRPSSFSFATRLAQRRFVDFSALPMQRRLRFAIDIGAIHDPSIFFRACGVERVSYELAMTASHDGETALHVFAHMLARATLAEQSRASWDSCIDCIRALIQYGADIHALMRFENRERVVMYTPLMLLAADGAAMSAQDLTQVWATILAETGIDLYAYGRRESQLWQQHSDQSGPLTTTQRLACSLDNVVGFEYGSTPSNWRLKHSPTLVTQFTVPVYTLGTPGRWPVSNGLPETVCWLPSDAEKLEGIWSFVRLHGQSKPAVQLRLYGTEDVAENAVVRPDINSSWDEDYNYTRHRLLGPYEHEWSEDDHGLLSLTDLSRRSSRREIRRICSMPRILSQLGIIGGNPNLYNTRDCHRCLRDGKVSLEHIHDSRDEHSWLPEYDLRGCIRGHDSIGIEYYRRIARRLRMEWLAGSLPG